MLIFFSGYFYKSTRRKNNIPLFSWYVLGQVIFFLVPYITIELLDLEMRFKQTQEIILGGLVILIISNMISFIIYKVNIKYKRKLKIEMNTHLNKVFIIIIYLASFFSLIFCLLNIIDIGLNNISNNMILRSRLSLLGPFAIVLMFPLGLSTYYWIRIIDGDKSTLVKYKTMFFSLSALIIAFFRGQRTDIVLIILLPLIYLFNKKRKTGLLVVSFIVLILFSSLYSILFKVNTYQLNLNIFDSIKRILTGDIDRNWTYWMALSQSKIASNTIMQKPNSGYIYTLFTFIPRRIASFKGYSTETWFVYFMGANFVSEWGVHSLADINWGITLSGISESIINGGYIGAIMYSVIVGYLLRKMESLLLNYNYLNACIPLVAMLLSGYTFYNIIIIYIPIIITLIIFNKNDSKKKDTIIMDEKS